MSENKKFRILLAEDNSINIKVAEYILRPIVSVLDVAENGEQAIEKFSNNEYDVILMDVKMPVMDGYEATQKIREMEKERGNGTPIPIIAITANNQVEEIEYCISIGMNSFVPKPFTTDDVLSVINSVLS